MGRNKGKRFYAVRQGRVRGIFETWEEARENVDGYSGAEFESFSTRAQAETFLRNVRATPIPLKKESVRHHTPTILPHVPSGVIVYTDGSCLGNGGKDARAGIGVYFGPSHPLNVSRRLTPDVYRQTNQVRCY